MLRLGILMKYCYFCIVRLTTIFGKSYDQNRECLITQRVNCSSQIFNATVWEHPDTKWILQIISQKNFDVTRPSFDTLFKIIISSIFFCPIRNSMLQFMKNDGMGWLPYGEETASSFRFLGAFTCFSLKRMAPFDWSDVRFPWLKKILHKTIHATFL